MLLLADIGCVTLVTLCFIQTRTLTSQTFVMPAIPMMVFGSNDLVGELSKSDSLLSHALIEIPGIPWLLSHALIEIPGNPWQPWITRMTKNVLVECS